MGDTNVKQEKPNPADPKSDSDSSLKELRSVKPSENITILDASNSSHSEDKKVVVEHQEKGEEPTASKSEQKTKTDAPPKDGTDPKVETFFEKPLEPTLSENKKALESVESKIEEVHAEPGEKAVTEQPSVEVANITEELPTDKPQPISLERTRLGQATSGLIYGERVYRNQSDIFSLKEQTSVSSAIFSVNGSPSRKLIRRKEMVPSNVFPFGVSEPPMEKVSPREKFKDAKECYNELTRPSGTPRNPLTGTGLSSNDEYKCKGSKRKDGNPLLGLGYSPEATPSAHRIPPGGFSHKLW